MGSNTPFNKKVNIGVSSWFQRIKNDPNIATRKKKFRRFMNSKILKYLPFLREEEWEPINWWERIFVNGTL